MAQLVLSGLQALLEGLAMPSNFCYFSLSEHSQILLTFPIVFRDFGSKEAKKKTKKTSLKLTKLIIWKASKLISNLI